MKITPLQSTYVKSSLLPGTCTIDEGSNNVPLQLLQQRNMDNLTTHLRSIHHSNNTSTSHRSISRTKNDNSNNNDVILSADFYSEFHGHKVSHLQTLLPHLRESSSHLIWTAGDSSLDNKYWFSTKADAVEGSGYERVLRPQQSICDVTYWLNYLAKERVRKQQSDGDGSSLSKGMAAINTAGEKMEREMMLFFGTNIEC